VSAARERVEAALGIAHAQGFAFRVALGTVLLGWTVAIQGQAKEGIAELRQGLAAYHATNAAAWWHYLLALLAEAYGTGGQIAEGLSTLTEALATMRTMQERFYDTDGEVIFAGD
jgi:hypothetical protein